MLAKDIDVYLKCPVISGDNLRPLIMKSFTVGLTPFIKDDQHIENITDQWVTFLSGGRGKPFGLPSLPFFNCQRLSEMALKDKAANVY